MAQPATTRSLNGCRTSGVTVAGVVLAFVFLPRVKLPEKEGRCLCSWRACVLIARGLQSRGRFDHQGVHECLRKVPPHLVLGDVVLFAE